MNHRILAIAGITAGLLFWLALAGFAAVRPEYTHAHKAVSELGIIGAPNALAWNLLGFVIPGLLLTICGAGLAHAIDGGRKVLWYLLVLAGIGFALTGVFPAEIKDGAPLMQSPLTILHLAAAMLSSLFWMFAALLLPWRTRRNPVWRKSTRLAVSMAVICVGGTIMNATLLPKLLPSMQLMPGTSQRIGFVFCLAWYFVFALRLLRAGATEKSTRQPCAPSAA